MCAQMRGMSSALSAASAACDHLRDWVHGTAPGTFVSMGVFSDGSYSAPKVGCPRQFNIPC
jgi:malate dehydrogenase